MKSSLIMKCLTLFIIMAFLLGACSPAATPTQPAAQEPTKAADATKAPEATKAPAAANPMDYLNAAREDTVIFDQPYKLTAPDNWNPFTPNNSFGWGMSQIGMDGLMYLNYGDGKYIMWMAEAATSNADATEWTLKLRKGITWNDGVAFNADDIIYSIDLQIKNDKLGNHFYWVEWLDKMTKSDDYTIVFTLKKPNVRFAAERFGGTLGLFQDAYIPKHIWETIGDPNTFKNIDIAKGLPMGTGAYIVAKITSNEVILVRNDNWWGAKTGLAKLPEPKKVVYSYVGTEEVRTQTAIDNGFDSMQDITVGALQAIVAQNNKWQAWYDQKPFAAPDPCARIISLNSLKKPWDDKDMRKMLSLVMDRQQIVDIAYEGSTSLAAYFWPAYPSMKPYADLIDSATYASFLKPDLAKAADIMKSKGYVKGAKYWAKDGKDLGIEIQVPEDFIELIRVGDVYVEQLQKFGINATEAKLGAVFYDNSANGDYEAQSNWFACGSINEPWSTLNTFAGDAAPLGERAKGPPVNNAFRWSNKQYTDLVAQIGTTKLDDPKLMDLTKQALAILYDELPAIPSAQSRKIVPFNNTYWTNWPTQKNYYVWPCNWCSVFGYAMTKIEKVKK
jgi:peptide/nickel transport system substrate-binding protein